MQAWQQAQEPLAAGDGSQAEQAAQPLAQAAAMAASWPPPVLQVCSLTRLTAADTLAVSCTGLAARNVVLCWCPCSCEITFAGQQRWLD